MLTAKQGTWRGWAGMWPQQQQQHVTHMHKTATTFARVHTVRNAKVSKGTQRARCLHFGTTDAGTTREGMAGRRGPQCCTRFVLREGRGDCGLSCAHA